MTAPGTNRNAPESRPKGKGSGASPVMADPTLRITHAARAKTVNPHLRVALVFARWPGREARAFLGWLDNLETDAEGRPVAIRYPVAPIQAEPGDLHHIESVCCSLPHLWTVPASTHFPQVLAAWSALCAPPPGF